MSTFLQHRKLLMHLLAVLHCLSFSLLLCFTICHSHNSFFCFSQSFIHFTVFSSVFFTLTFYFFLFPLSLLIFSHCPDMLSLSLPPLSSMQSFFILHTLAAGEGEYIVIHVREWRSPAQQRTLWSNV